MIKCSFCEQPLICKSCGRPFRPRRDDLHRSAYQPDMEVSCQECHQVLICKGCGYVYGEAEEAE